MLFAMLGMVVFNLADTYFIGQLGTVPLAALTFTLPVILFINNLALGVVMMSGVALNVLNQPMKSAAISFIQMFLLYIPLAYLGLILFGVYGIFFALLASNILIGFASNYIIKREIGALLAEAGE